MRYGFEKVFRPVGRLGGVGGWEWFLLRLMISRADQLSQQESDRKLLEINFGNHNIEKFYNNFEGIIM